MVDATTKKILRLLRPEHPLELRCAAALVLGEVGARDEEISQALCAALDDAEPALRAQAIQAVGRLRIDKALPRLLDRVSGGGPEAELAARAAAHQGSRGTRALQDLMAKVAPGLRRRIAAALATGGTASAEIAAVDTLLDNDPGVVDAAVRTLTAQAASLGESHRRALADHLLDLLGPGPDPALAAHSEAALVRLLAALGDARGEAVFWARVDPPRTPELRAAALQALGALSAVPDGPKLRRLLVCAADSDFRVVAPALMLLKAVPVTGRNLKDWLPLLSAPDTAARRFAIDKLAGSDTPEVAAALLGQLGHRDASLRAEALACLSRLDHGREALAKALLEAGSPDDAWALTRAVAPLFRDYPAALHTRIFNQACAYLEAHDRRAEPLLHLLREADAPDLRDRLERRALDLRRQGEWATALTYLRLLGRDPTCGEALRFEQAACGLKVSDHDLSAEHRASDPCLGQFARLVHSHATPPLDYLESADWLEGEDLFYLGFHFVEGHGREREFGAAVLKILVRRWPRSKRAKDARQKLKSQGVE
jgi:HEAT repeat protein